MYYFDPQRFLDVEAIVLDAPPSIGGGKVSDAGGLFVDITEFCFWDQGPSAITKVTLTALSGVAVSPSTINYITVNLVGAPAFLVTGTLTKDTLPLAEVVTDGSGITLLTDLRTVYQKPDHEAAVGGDLSGTMPNPQIAAGVIVDADINGSAAIAQSKLALSITDSEVNAAAAIAQSKLALSITDSEVNAGAAILESKLNLNFATHDNSNDPTTDQKAALVGTGTPGAGDKYVNESTLGSIVTTPAWMFATASGDVGGLVSWTPIQRSNATHFTPVGTTVTVKGSVVPGVYLAGIHIQQLTNTGLPHKYTVRSPAGGATLIFMDLGTGSHAGGPPALNGTHFFRIDASAGDVSFDVLLDQTGGGTHSLIIWKIEE
jgi:hypothetical protein